MHLSQFHVFIGERNLAQRIATLFSEYLENHLEEIETLTDVKALFTELKQQGYVLGIATSDSYAATYMTLKHLDVLPLIDFIGTGDMYPAKPDALVLESFCRQTGVDKQQVMVVGDSLVDVQLGAHGKMGILIAAEDRLNIPEGVVNYKSIADIPYERYFLFDEQR